MTNKDIITSYKYAELSDFVFSGVFTNEQLKKLSLQDYKVLSAQDGYQTIIHKSFDISSGNVIFSSLEYIEILFGILKSQKKLCDLTLITHQSDRSVKESLFKKRPDSINKWFAINIEFSHKDLIPIPLGLSNLHPKNLNEDDISFVESEKSKLLYINFQENTNYNHRRGLYDYFDNKEWCYKKIPNLSIKEFSRDLNFSKFILCPWGNGIDTHRIWESLYSGSYPITKSHVNFESLKELPILFVDDYKEVNKDYLENTFKKFQSKKFDLNKLYFKYWREYINSTKIDSNNTVLHVNSYKYFFLITIKKFKDKLNSKLKILIYYYRKISYRLSF